jgi:hypothetical protein
MLCVPCARLLLLQVAVLLLALPAGSATALQPLSAAPSALNATLPVGAVPVTVAVKVTLAPTTDGLAELATTAVPVDLLTVCASVLLVEALLPLSPA